MYTLGGQFIKIPSNFSLGHTARQHVLIDVYKNIFYTAAKHH